MSLASRLRGNFLAGPVLVAPLAVTVLVLQFLFIRLTDVDVRVLRLLVTTGLGVEELPDPEPDPLSPGTDSRSAGDRDRPPAEDNGFLRAVVTAVVRLGILDAVGLAGTLIFAIPAALLGLEFLVFGDRPFVGGVLVVVAVLMVVLPRYVVTPGDLPTAVAGEAVERAVDDAPDGSEPESASESDRDRNNFN